MTLSAWYEFNKPFLRAFSFKIIVKKFYGDEEEIVLQNDNIIIDDAIDLYGPLEVLEVIPVMCYTAILEIILKKEVSQR